MNDIVVLDFETTGMSAGKYADRAIEIGAVKIRNGQIIDEFGQLMNPGVRINAFIEDFTGISNAMLKGAPDNAEVMSQFSHFIQGCNLVAHNASFDQRFLDMELELINSPHDGQFTCSMLLARRLFQEAPNHKLGTLVSFLNIQTDGNFHRALSDAQMTGQLWLLLLEQAETLLGKAPSFADMKKLSKMPKQKINQMLANA